MDDQESEIIPQLTMQAMEKTETTVFPNPGVVDVAVGVDDKSNNTNGEGGNQGGVNVSVVSGGGGETEFRAKRKRGRPRKDETTMVERRADFMVVPEYSSAPPQKRGRGRPKGSGKLQHMGAASLGGQSTEIGTAGSNFTPCVITLQVGEDIYQTLWSFSEKTLDSICILSACGTLSSAEIRLPGSRGGTVKHEGCLHIMSLNGSHTYTEQGVQRGKNCLLSVHFVNAEGEVFGGSVVGPLIVSAPTMLVIGTFREPVMMRRQLEPPKPKNPPNTIVAVPLQMVNGMFLDSGSNEVATVPPMPTPQADDLDKSAEEPAGIGASHQHPPLMNDSGDVMSSQDANPVLDQQDPPVDDVYKVEMCPDTVPESFEPTDWNSLQTVESEHVSEPDIGATDKMTPDIVPASPQPTDWNSLQPVEPEHVSGPDRGATDQ